MKRLDLSEDSKVSLPAKNLLAILAACIVGTMTFFSIQERITVVETELQLITKDLEAANDFIEGVPKGDMVSPQIQEIYMLVEFLAESVEKLKTQMEEEIPMIQKNDMVIQFHEERIIDLEQKNGTY